ncbi:hypothetical protein NEDG_02254, partial [Nematocida displodere]
MKSNLVRSFGKVFETSLGKRLGKVLGKALWCHVLCLIVLCVIVGCADEVSEPNYIVSPYTEQTMEFFDRSRSDDWPNRLETVEIDGQRCILKKQTRVIFISLQNYTLETVPEKLVEGIPFFGLALGSDEPSDPAVLEKILSVFGTINAWLLELRNLEVRVSSDNDEHPRPPRCVINANIFRISHTPKTTIEWVQKRLALSESQLLFIISCMPDFGNLEVLDGFSPACLVRLALHDIDKLDSLDCKLFREGPLPDELEISGNSTVTTPKISEEIIWNMLAKKKWVSLRMPVELWVELMKPSEQPKLLRVGYLQIVFCPGSSIPTPVVGMDRVTAGYLSIRLTNAKNLLTITDAEQTLDWVSTAFVGLETLIVDGPSGPELKYFIRSHTIDIPTIPTLKRIEVFDVECLHDPNIIRDDSKIVCLSLEAWELFGSGKLGDELANSQTDLSQLS